MRIHVTTTLAASLALLVGLSPRTVRADVVTDWNETTVQAIRSANLGPNPGTRALAVVHLSVHDAVNAARHEHRSYASAPVGVVDPVSVDAAAITAAHRALTELFPAQKATFDAKLATALGAIPEGAARTNGINAGTAAAASIVAARANDGSTTLTGSFPGATTPGAWRPTPPKFAKADAPWWRQVRPFVLMNAAQFRPAAPPALDSSAFTTALAEVADLGQVDSATRTAEQTEIANFWAQATHVPFNEIARKVATTRALALVDSARLFALLNLALADSRIAAWDSKYTYGFWRPITALAADPNVDGGTAHDAGDGDGGVPWTSLLETPAHPDYVSGHSTTGAAGAKILQLFFATDAASFSVGSDTLPAVTRSFTSFSAAADENGRSRIYGGIHYEFSNVAGKALGASVAQWVFDHALQDRSPPVEDAGVIADAAPTPTTPAPPPTATPDASVEAPAPTPPADSSCSIGFAGAGAGAALAWTGAMALLLGARRRRR